MAALVQNMGVNHRRFQIPVTQQSLDGPNIRSTLQKMRRKTVSESVCGNPLSDPGLANRHFDRLVDQRSN